MGKRVIALASGDKRFSIAGAFEKKENPSFGLDCGEVAGVGKIGIPITEKIVGFDVLIDFSSPEGILSALDLALENNASFVSGTTGLNEKIIGLLKESSKKIGVFHAPNFSAGIAAVEKAAVELSKMLGNADIEINEKHHNLKADAPSGTALKLAKAIADNKNIALEENAVYCRKGNIGARKKDEIGILSLRGGGIVGDHEIIFANKFETIIVEHRAISRDLFAAGALDAAEFIFGKTGFFDMNDLINQ